MEDRGAGWVLFAGIMLFLAGVLKFFDAIWAFTYMVIAALVIYALAAYGGQPEAA